MENLDILYWEMLRYLNKHKHWFDLIFFYSSNKENMTLLKIWLVILVYFLVSLMSNDHTLNDALLERK